MRGVTRTVGNEIDEFITEALRNNLVGLPLDLAVLNLARGRDTGIPSLNEARREFYAMTSNNDVGDQNVKPYTSWVDFLQHLKHPESLINFIAAYGTHAALTAADVDTMVEKRAVAAALVLGGSAIINAGTPEERTFTADEADRLAFLNSTGIYANVDLPGPDGVLGTADDKRGVTTTGVDAIDFWVGGLAEEADAVRRPARLDLQFRVREPAREPAERRPLLLPVAHGGPELRHRAREQFVRPAGDAQHRRDAPAGRHLPDAGLHTRSRSRRKQFTGLGDATHIGVPIRPAASRINGVEIVPLVIRDNPDTVGPDSNYLHYTGDQTVVLGGTEGNDILIAGSSDDDTVYGDGGNDRIDGGFGERQPVRRRRRRHHHRHGRQRHHSRRRRQRRHFRQPFIAAPRSPEHHPRRRRQGLHRHLGRRLDDLRRRRATTSSTAPSRTCRKPATKATTGSRLGTQDGAPGDNFNPFLLDDVPGNDIFVGGGGFDEMIGEGGDDIFVGSDAQDKMDGMSGFDWVTYKTDQIGVTVDLELAALNEPPIAASPASILDRFAEVEGLSGSEVLRLSARQRSRCQRHRHVQRQDQRPSGARHRADRRPAGVPRSRPEAAPGTHVTEFGTGNIILGGDGSDIILGRGGDDLIDGDKWLNVRISVRANLDGTGPEIASYDSLAPMIPLMLDGTYNPGQLVAVRELLDGSGGFDTAVYPGQPGRLHHRHQRQRHADHFRDDVVTVTDNSATPRDGTDHLTHIERLQFADQFDRRWCPASMQRSGRRVDDHRRERRRHPDRRLADGVDRRCDRPGQRQRGQSHGAVTGPVRYTWQAEFVPGSGVFDDIILLPGGDLAFESASGTVFRAIPLVDGLSLRVKAIYQDAHGVTEQVFSAPTAPVVAVAPPPPTTPVTRPTRPAAARARCSCAPTSISF